MKVVTKFSLVVGIFCLKSEKIITDYYLTPHHEEMLLKY